MENLTALWSGLTLRRKSIVAGATLAMFAAILALARLSATPDLSLLYAGLDGAAAGDILRVLDQEGVAYEVRGDAIYVASDRRDSLRLALAAEGLPGAGGSGYELLDGLSGFSTTAQMFDAAYLRAKEGELARTLLANPNIRAARVHIAQAPSGPFRRDQAATASVAVTASAALSADQAQAIRSLVSAAVLGLRAEDVQVVDTARGLVANATDIAEPQTRGAARAAEIRANVERLLGARVGAGKAVVEVSVELETESEAISERRFDPQGRVAISSETEERSGQDSTGGGTVTVASNLPDGDAGDAGGGTSRNSETRERINYEVSETQRELVRAPGAIKRLSVAVLVDGETDGAGTWAPRDEAELEMLRELVASAIGFDEARGDQLILRSLQFVVPEMLGSGPEAGFLPAFGPVNTMETIKLAVLALVALVLGLFVLRPLAAAALRPVAALPPPSVPLAIGAEAASGAGAVSGPGAAALTGELSGAGIGADRRAAFEVEAGAKDPVDRLRRLIESRQTESIEILRGWMEREEEAG